MKIITKFFLFAILILISGKAYSQIENTVHWQSKSTLLKNGDVELIFTAQIEDHWHLYSQFFSDGGPIKLSFNFEENANYKRIGKVSETPKPHAEFDDLFEIEIKYFEKKAVFKQKIKVLSEKPFVVKVTVEGQVCYTDGMCVQMEEDFKFDIAGVVASGANINDNIVENDTIINGTTEEISSNTSTDNSVKPDTSSIEKYNTDTLKTNKSKTYNLDENPDALDDESLLGLFFIAFLLGLSAIITPCVFPMIPMTVTFFLHSGGSKKRGKFLAIVYGLSIILIYTFIGTLVAVLFGPSFANFISTHWLPNILFFLVFIIFAASFFGLFEITLPSWIVNKADQQADKGGIMGAFFMALTLAVVSFSCTGPLVGSLLVKSAGGKMIEPIIGMFGFSLAFAVPFTLFAFFPSWLKNMPKSGGWLNSVKVVLGFLELAFGLKFLSVADLTYHWGILDREVYLAIWIVIFAFLGLYLLGKINFESDSKVSYIKVPRLMMAILTFSFVVYLIPGMFGAPLKVLSGFLPPQSTNDFDLHKIIRENASAVYTKEDKTVREKPKYSDFLHLPHGLKGYFDYEQGMKCAKKINKPVFLDFTGHGCQNCRLMEASVWSDPRVLRRLKEDFVIIALYTDDKKVLPESEWITDEKGKIRKTLGKINSDFQAKRFKRNAQPYYVLLDHEGNMLVRPKAYDTNPDNFIDFLDSGLNAFNGN